MRNHDTECKRWSNGKCPCLTCKHDTRTGYPKILTKCCDLVCHRINCKDHSVCMDYEPEGDVKHDT